MRNLYKYTAIIVILLVFPTGSQAFDKVGTTAAQFLQIGVGGRLPGMGGAGVALIDGPEALYWNPGRIQADRHFALGAYYADWIGDLRHQFIGVTVPVGYAGVIGFHAISLGGDEFEQTTLTYQEGNGVMVEYRDMALGASYAHRLTDQFSVGGTFKYIHQKLFHETASTVAIDLGTSLQTDLPGLTIGMAMTNLGGEMKLSGRDLLTDEDEDIETEYQVSSWPLPLSFQVGIGWKISGPGGTFNPDDRQGLLFAFDGKHVNEGLTYFRTGIEYDFNRLVFLRMGRVFDHDTEGWSFGAGLNVSVRSFAMRADFAFADLGDLQAVKRISVVVTAR